MALLCESPAPTTAGVVSTIERIVEEDEKPILEATLGAVAGVILIAIGTDIFRSIIQSSLIFKAAKGVDFMYLVVDKSVGSGL